MIGLPIVTRMEKTKSIFVIVGTFSFLGTLFVGSIRGMEFFDDQLKYGLILAGICVLVVLTLEILEDRRKIKYSEFETKVECCDWNPKNMPNEKKGKCENPDHKEWTGKEIEDNDDLHLMMNFSEEYNHFLEVDKDKLLNSPEELDKQFDYFEDKKYKPGTEHYYCIECLESLNA